MLAGSTVTNTGPTILDRNRRTPREPRRLPRHRDHRISPGIVTGARSNDTWADAVAIQAQNDLTTAYNNLAGRPTTVDLTGQNLGGLTLVPGVYNFSSSAQLTGTLTLNGLGNPNSSSSSTSGAR